MSDLLLIAIFTIHLLAADLAMAGPLMALWLEWRGARRADPIADRISRRIAIWSLAAVAVAVGLGLLAVFALPQLEPAGYREAFARVPAARWWGSAGEIGFFVVCMAVYAGAWQSFARVRWLHRMLAAAAATDLLYHFPLLFTIISTLSLRPAPQGQELDVPLYRHLMFEGETFSRVVHHWVAAVAVGAVAVMILAVGKGPGDKGHEGQDKAAAIARSASRLALFVTVLQVLIGVWVLIAMSPAMQNQLLGEDWISTGLFGLSVVAALGLMHHLSIVALGAVSRSTVYRTAIVMAITITLMSATLHRARQCVLEPARAANAAR